MLHMTTQLSDATVELEFNWYTDEPDWDSMSVYAQLPLADDIRDCCWVKVNDLLSNQQWDIIEKAIYANEDELRRQAIEQEY